MLYAFGLEQLVYFSTHVGGTVLDFVITETTNRIKVLRYEPSPLISDQSVVTVVLNIRMETEISKTTFFRKLWRSK